MKQEILRLGRSCLSCQKAKVSRHTVTPWKDFVPADERFASLHSKLVGPFPPTSDGFLYLLTASHVTWR